MSKDASIKLAIQILVERKENITYREIIRKNASWSCYLQNTVCDIWPSSLVIMTAVSGRIWGSGGGQQDADKKLFRGYRRAWRQVAYKVKYGH